VAAMRRRRSSSAACDTVGTVNGRIAVASFDASAAVEPRGTTSDATADAENFLKSSLDGDRDGFAGRETKIQRLNIVGAGVRAVDEVVVQLGETVDSTCLIGFYNCQTSLRFELKEAGRR
jgi:hypothetical protein